MSDRRREIEENLRKAERNLAIAIVWALVALVAFVANLLLVVLR